MRNSRVPIRFEPGHIAFFPRLYSGLALLALVLFNLRVFGAEPRIVQFREPRLTRYTLIDRAHSPAVQQRAASTGAPWTQAQVSGSTNIFELGDRVVLQLAAGHSVDEFIAGRNAVVSRELSPHLFILQTPDSEAAIDLAEALAKEEGVVSSYPVMRRPLRRYREYAKPPNDPLFADQWHLDNRGSDLNLSGVDLGVRGAWPVTRGGNVLVAIADDGIDLEHAELAESAEGSPHFNFYYGTTNANPSSAEAHHATAVAGLIAAQGNNERGVIGVAPEARISSWVIFGTSFFGRESFASDEQLMDMYQYALDEVAVQNHSWGGIIAQLPPDALYDIGISNAVTHGRGGKGIVIVRAGGNLRDATADANDDAFTSDPRIIAVAAVRKNGRVCSYSNPGACLLVAAPSGDGIEDPEAEDVLTTDRTGIDGYNTAEDDSGDYTSFNGTSASCPQIAGIAALIVSANSNLTYRDVQQVLLHSARHYDLADPDVRWNGAGFRVSHNVGFGIPDAGVAVTLARGWSNRPPAATVSFTNTVRQAIPDDALRLVCEGFGTSSALASVRCLPALGPHPDAATATLPLVYVGQANEDIDQDLRGKAALIERGVSFFSEKITRAANAGAEFVVIFNNTGTTELLFMGGTSHIPVPAVFIGRTDGEELRDLIAADREITARLQLTPATYSFEVPDTLVTEHVGVRLKTTHTSRSDVRVTLVSPMGTRSVLQALNSDGFEGPTDWTYWSVQHFYESSAGVWRLEVSDEDDTRSSVPSGSGTPATGAVTYAELIIKGVPIDDSDRDGLEDDWEREFFGHLDHGPAADPDDDGWNNAREQVLRTAPSLRNFELRVDLAELQSGYWRLSWPAHERTRYTILEGQSVSGPWRKAGEVENQFPVAEWIVRSDLRTRLYRVLAETQE